MSDSSQRYIGLMSGTSLDAIDAVLLDCAGTPSLQCAINHPLPDTLRRDILALCQGGADELARAGALHLALGELFAEAVRALLHQAGVDAASIRAIGCHGQTIRHCPGQAGFTVQLGSADVLAVRTGIPVVCDFRNRDLVLGGQGAPLVPAFHQAMWAGLGRVAVVNIGGMANITLLDQGVVEGGFDTGPGNVLLDYWINKVRAQRYDQDGGWAASGQPDQSLLERLLSDPYFAAAAPKSTGREHFNGHWLERHLGNQQAVDVQATLLELTCRSIADALQPWQAGQVLVCGGGARNSALMTRLQAMLGGIPLATSDSAGMPAEWVEGAAFAWLARARLCGQPGNCPSVTGARRAAVLGALYLP